MGGLKTVKNTFDKVLSPLTPISNTGGGSSGIGVSNSNSNTNTASENSVTAAGTGTGSGTVTGSGGIAMSNTNTNNSNMNTPNTSNTQPNGNTHDSDRDRYVLRSGDAFRLRSLKFPGYEMGITNVKTKEDYSYLGLRKVGDTSSAGSDTWCQEVHYYIKFNSVATDIFKMN